VVDAHQSEAASKRDVAEAGIKSPGNTPERATNEEPPEPRRPSRRKKGKALSFDDPSPSPTVQAVPASLQHPMALPPELQHPMRVPPSLTRGLLEASRAWRDGLNQP
jgi:hypothetical protein